MKNYISITLLAFICAFSISQLSAQDQKQETKVVVIEKVKNSDGKVVEKKTIKPGEEAEKYLKEMEDTIDLGDEEVRIVEKHAFKFVARDEDGNEQIIEWEGSDDEMPEEIKEKLEKMKMEIGADEFEKQKRVKVIMREEGGETDKEVEVIVEDEDLIIKDINSNKAQLGVYVEEHEKGVKVIDVMESSAAEKAGISKGDVITRINDVRISSIESLMSALSGFEPNDIIVIETLAGEKSKAYEVTLQKRKEVFKYKTWKEVEKEKK